MGIEVKRYTIKTAMGQGRDMGSFGNYSWTQIFDEQTAKDLDTIGYTGKLNGVKTSVYEYLEKLSDDSVKYDLHHTKGDSGEFTDEYSLTVVEVLGAPLKHFKVSVPVISWKNYYVEARNETEAKQKAADEEYYDVNNSSPYLAKDKTLFKVEKI